jgi:CRISPR-associated protein Cas2
MAKKYMVISYDVVDDRKRTRVSKVLINHGRRVQKSVFECLITEKQYLSLKEALEKIIDMEKDSVRYYTLCAGCIHNIQFSGWGTVTENEDTIII